MRTALLDMNSAGATQARPWPTNPSGFSDLDLALMSLALFLARITTPAAGRSAAGEGGPATNEPPNFSA
eukprot:13191382-Alexandrium_andersonii.AAC.1